MTQNIPPGPSNSPKVVVELGIGNGGLLKKLVEMEKENNGNATTRSGSLYIGIELDSLKCDTAEISPSKLCECDVAPRIFRNDYS